MTSRYDWLWKGLAVAYLAYYVLSPAPVVCASDKSTTTCRNVSHQVVVNETTEELCGYLSLAYCYFLSSCYCNITREVAKTHVTTVCEGTANVSGNISTTSLNVTLSPPNFISSPSPLTVGEVISSSSNPNHSTTLSSNPTDIGEATPTSTQLPLGIGQNTSDKIVTVTPRQFNLLTGRMTQNVSDWISVVTPQLANLTTEWAQNNTDKISTIVPQSLHSTTDTTRNMSDKFIVVAPRQLNSSIKTTGNVSDKCVTAEPQLLNSTKMESARNISHKVDIVTAQEFNSTTEEATRNASGRAVTIKPQMLISNTDEMAKNVSLKVGTVTVQSTTRKTASVSTMRHRVEAVSEESTLKTPAIGKISTSPEAPLAAAISPSTLPVTATTLPEDSADMAMSELYYNVSETNSSLLLGSDPGGTNTGASRGLFRNLTDAEVAAIAVISSLLFSIVLSITVFFIQRRHRGYLVRKNARTQVVQVQLADGEQAEGNAEGAAFLPPSQEQRYIHVKPANMAQNVYEQHPLHPPTDKAELSLESGKLSARYVTKPAAVASDQVKGSTPPAQPIVKPPDTSASKQNVYSDDFPSCELTVKPTEQPPVYSSLKSLHDPPEEKENDITSASSLQLNLSEDHYENVAPADT